MSANDPAAEADSDDDFDWEEVDVSQPMLSVSEQPQDQAGPSDLSRGNIEITIQARARPDEAAKKRAAQRHAERVRRLDCHKMHTICLIANAKIRNGWLNDELLHARLMSLTPIALQNAFVISKTKVPEAPMRGRMFEAAITRLAEWWHVIFEVETTGHLRNRTYEEVQQMLSAALKGKGRALDSDDEDEDEIEIVRSEKSLMKHALMKRGSRDVSAQLFTALCRALGIPARLVVSLQSVPWQAGIGKPKQTYKKKVKSKGKGKQKVVDVDGDEDEEDMEEVSIPGTPASVSVKSKDTVFSGTGHRLDNDGGTDTPADAPKRKAPPVITLRKSRGRKLGSAPVSVSTRILRPPDPRTSAPVFWTEVFSRADGRWLPVDPIRCIINKRKAFDPDQSSNPNAPAIDRNLKVENRMVYVVAFEEDGYARDVTPRYAREYGAKVSKMQQGGKGRKQWWEMILGVVTRPYRLNRDDVEDEELHNNQLTEQMPTSMAGFKGHPLYVLSRHLKRDEVIYPLTELGKFRGEPVYARSSVITLKTAENWMRQGRKVKEGCQPMKWVKQRAVTVNKKRAIEVAMGDRKGLDDDEGVGSEKDVMQGLYAQNQTELYTADPVIDGAVPKNDFGNIDLYVPSMLPAGGAYIPHKGAAKVARQLGFDFSEAVTSFEFKKRRAFPVITGIVVAAENEETILEAFWEAEHEAEKKRNVKRQEQVIKRWTRLVQGLRIRQRLQEQYVDRGEQASENDGSNQQGKSQVVIQEAGGFLVGADDVVQPYSLPKDVHNKARTPPPESMSMGVVTQASEIRSQAVVPPSLAVENDSQDEDMDMIEEIVPKAAGVVPKTMRELAQDAHRDQIDVSSLSLAEILATRPASPSAPALRIKANGRNTSSAIGILAPAPPPPRTGQRKGPTITLENAQRNSRGRKRARHNTSDSERGSGHDLELTAGFTPSKRGRPARSPVAKSDRVLRTRRGKDEHKLRQEQEMEEAYRKAIAD